MNYKKLLLALFLPVVGLGTARAIDKVDGWYQIATAADLQEFAQKVNNGEKMACAVLTADIDCGDAKFYIGSDANRFQGEFDGQGHTVTINFNMPGEGENLFRNIDRTGLVRNLIVDGTITTNAKFAAGIAGWNGGFVMNCVSKVVIKSSKSGDATHGGIVAVTEGNSVVTNCLSLYQVKSADGGQNSVTTNCGGVVGWANNDAYIRNCLSVADIDLSSKDGSASISRMDGGSKLRNDTETRGKYQQNFYRTAIGSTRYGEAVDDAKLASGEVCYQLNAGMANPQWSQNPGDAYPMPFPSRGQQVGASATADCKGRFAAGSDGVTYTFGGGQAATPHRMEGGRCKDCGFFDFDLVDRATDGHYLLATADHCKWYSWMRYHRFDEVDARMTADIDMGAAPYFTNSDNWVAGDFDGAGHTLTIAISDADLAVSSPNADGFKDQPFSKGNNCLFHNLKGTVHDLYVKGSITSRSQFAGTVTNTTQAAGVRISNVYSEVDIRLDLDDDATAGGFIGLSSNSPTLENVAFAGSIRAIPEDNKRAKKVGGIIGWVNSQTTLKNVLCVPTAIDLADFSDSHAIGRSSSKLNLDNVYYSLGGMAGMAAAGGATEVSMDDVRSGALTYQLNGDQSTVSWRQNLPGDIAPVPLASHQRVYGHGQLKCDGTPEGSNMTYSNVEEELNVPPHTYENHLCTVCHQADYDYFVPNASGVFEIGQPYELAGVAQTINYKKGDLLAKTIKLTADIDMTGYSDYFQPIGTATDPFHGTFDGQGHVISHLNINRPSDTYVGLLGAVYGTSGHVTEVKNVTLDATCAITGYSFVGLVGATAGRGTYENNVVRISRVGMEGPVAGNADAGVNAAGVLGCCLNNAATIELTDCYMTGKVTGKKENAQICGWVGTHATLTRCWATNEVMQGSEHSNNFVRKGTATFNNCYTTFTGAGVDKIELADAASGKLCMLLNGDLYRNTDVWHQNLDNGQTADAHPVLRADHAVVYKNGFYSCSMSHFIGPDITYSNTKNYTIAAHEYENGICTEDGCRYPDTDYKQKVDDYYELGNATDVKWFAEMVNQIDGHAADNAKLTADIDFQQTGTRIGCNDRRYCGTFDGQSHVISNYKVDNDQDYQGLFGIITGGANIKNFVFDNTCTIKAHSYAGIIGGSRGSGDIHITRVGNEGTVTVDKQNAAGIMGVDDGGAARLFIDQCYTTGRIEGRNAGTKGNAQICGWTGENSLITNSWSISEVINPQSGREFSHYGGNNHGSQYQNCFTTYRETNAGLTYETPLPAFASGEVCYKINAGGNTYFYQTIGTDATPCLDASHGTVDHELITVSAAGYATLLPKTNTTLPAGVTAKKVTGVENGLLVMEETELEPYKPVILEGSCGASGNLLDGVTLTQHTYYAKGDNWEQMQFPTVTENNGEYSFTLPTATNYQWQAQFWLKSNIATDAAATYEYSVTLCASKAISGVTVKLPKEGDDNCWYIVDRINLSANTDYTLTRSGLWGKEMDKLNFVFDFGGNPEGTEIKISNISFRRTADFYGNTAAAGDLKNGLLVGVTENTAAPVGSYVLQNQNDHVAFYRVAEGKQPTVGAYKAYLSSAASNVQALYFEDLGNETAIEGVEATPNESNSVIYNVAGQRISRMQKGVNIINGKKILQ